MVKKAKSSEIEENDIVTFVPATAEAANQAVVVKSPTERAVAALSSTETESKLRELVLSSADIVAVIDPAGREQAHRIGMTLKNARIAIEKTGKAAREDAVAFGKAVVAEEKRLIGLVTTEEDRVFKLRDDYDEQEAAREAERKRVEAERVAALRARVTAIVGLPSTVAGAASIDIFNLLRDLAARDVATEGFAELEAAALAAVNAAGIELNTMYEAAQLREKEEADRLAALALEKAQIEAQAEENQREAAKLAEARRLQAEEDEARRARAKSEADAQARAAAEAQRKLDEQAAEVEAQRKATEADAAALAARMKAFEDAQQREMDHGPALEENARIDAERAEAKRIDEETPRWSASAGSITQTGWFTPPQASEFDQVVDVTFAAPAALAPVAEVAVEVEPETAPAPAERAPNEVDDGALRAAVWTLLETKTPGQVRALVNALLVEFAGVDRVQS